VLAAQAELIDGDPVTRLHAESWPCRSGGRVGGGSTGEGPAGAGPPGGEAACASAVGTNPLDFTVATDCDPQRAHSPYRSHSRICSDLRCPKRTFRAVA
jgi:hypothetical protein